MEIEFHGLDLKGIIEFDDIDNPFDERDSSYFGYNPNKIRPGVELIEKLNLTPSENDLIYKTSDEKEFSFLEIWSDNPQEKDAYTPFSEGERFWVDQELMLEYLKIKNMSLIIEVEIDRKKRGSRETYSEEYTPAKHKVYVLHQSGKLESAN